VTIGEDTVFTSCNATNAFFSNDPNNILPWPDARTASAQDNVALVALSATPGHAGQAQASVGISFQWDLLGYTLEEVADWPVQVTINCSYDIAAFWTLYTGSGNAAIWITFCTNVWPFQTGQGCYDWIGFETDQAGTHANVVSFTALTTVGGLEALNRTIGVTIYCQAHSAPDSGTINSSSATATIESIRIDPIVPVTTLPPTNVANVSATLNGSVNTISLPATAYFQYGTDITYGNTTPTTTIIPEAGQNVVPFSANLSGLDENTIYHYQAVAVVDGTSYYGADQTVTTEPSTLTLAYLSADTYNTTPRGINAGVAYMFLANYGDVGPAGFDAIAYTSADTSQIVVAFRGTVLSPPTFTSVFNVIADWGLAGGPGLGTLAAYCNAAAAFVSGIQSEYPNANITLTGHSLGGALAQLVGQASGLTAVAFNAPGSAELVDTLSTFLNPVVWPVPIAGNPMVNYRIDGDVISEVPLAFPQVITIDSPYPIPNAADPVMSFLAYLPYILADHDCETVIIMLAAGANQTPGFRGPNLLPVLLAAVQAENSTVISPLYQVLYNFAFQVKSQGGVLLALNNGGGSDFILTAASGSPLISAITLPAWNNVVCYVLRFLSGAAWSSFQTAQPGVPFNFDPVSAVEVVPVDVNGNPVIITNLVCGVYFASTGSFTGTLAQSTNAPAVPPMIHIAQVRNHVTLSWIAAQANNYQLQYSTNLSQQNWINVGSIITASNTVLSVTNTIAPDRQGFYRVQQQ